MAADEFCAKAVGDIAQIEVAGLGRHLGVEEHLQKQIAEFFGQVGKVSALNGVEDFVGLFESVFADSVERLLAIPGAAIGSTQPSHDGHRLLKESRGPRRIGCCSDTRCGWRELWTVCASCNVH